MSDYNSSLPIRTETNGDAAVKVVDGTTTSQALGVDASGRVTVKLTDGTGTAVTSQVNGTQRALDVGINVSGTQIDPRSIRALTSADVVTANIGTVGTLALNTSVTGLQVTQGSTTSGQSGTLIQGAVTTGAPAYTTAQTSPLSLTTAGLLRVDGSGVTQPVSGTVAATQSGTWTVQPGNTQNTTAWLVQDLADGSVGAGTAGTKSLLAGLVFNNSAPTLTNGQQAALQGDASANLKVNLITALPTGANTIGAVTQASGPWTVTGTGTAGSAATGVVTVQGIGGGTAIPVSGTVTATNPSVGTDGSAIPTSSTLIGASDGTNLQQLLVESSSNRNLRVGIYNGSTEVAVKAASTAALAADPSMVVALSPNSPIPTGSNNIGNVGILVGGSANSATNPLYVTNESQAGTPVNVYNTSAAVAAAATATFDYTVTAAKTFYGTQLWVSGSGKIKVQISFETAAASGTFNVVWTGFNSTADTNILIPLADKTQVTGAKVRVVITNRDAQAQDLYSTLSGTEI